MACCRGGTISATDFPIYTIRMLGNRHFLVAGGGGQAKTGVSNVFKVYELQVENGMCTANQVLHYDVGEKAIMNSRVFFDGKNHILAAGMEGTCQLYCLKHKVILPKKDEKEDKHEKEGVRKRKSSKPDSEGSEPVKKEVSFEVEPLGEVKSDTSADGGFQKVVDFTSDHSLMLTAGADGFFRAWQYPSLKKLFEVQAHTNEVDDLSVSPIGNKIVTVSRDKHAYIWDTKTGKKHCELEWSQKTDVQYRYRSCRFSIVSDKKDTYSLFTTHVPCVRSTKPQPSYITKWDTSKFITKKIVNAGTEELSSLALSHDGVFLGVGTILGSVSVYISFSLQRLYDLKAAHKIFVTSLEFAPPSVESRAVTGDKEFTMFSISADNQIKIHQQTPRREYNVLWVIAGFALIIYCLFWLLSALGL